MEKLTTIQYVNMSFQIWGAILTAIIVVCIFIRKTAQDKTRFFYTALLITNACAMLFDAFALLCRGGTHAFDYYGVRVFNLLSFCSTLIIPTLFLRYLTSCFDNEANVTRRPIAISCVICVVYLTLYVLNVFFPFFYYIDAQNIYHRASLYPVTFLPGFANIVLALYLLFRYKNRIEKNQFNLSIFYLFIPLPLFAIQMFIYGLNLIHFVSMIIMIVIFIFFQVDQAHKSIEIEKALIEKELALSESKNSLILSQIQPHFLYNALTSIYSLCDIKPDEAKNAISDFSTYLRGNLDSIKQTKMISFAEELKHLQAYLSLEKIRFDEYLEIVYDIKVSEFFIPPLSVQPLVENAINHGVSDLPSGGKVVISTEETDEHYIVKIIDNGIGFDENAVKNDGRSHVGISSVRNRLQIMCKGALTIDSKLNDGTTAIIKIPKGETAL